MDLVLMECPMMKQVKVLLVLLAMAGTAHAAGDVAKGGELFAQECAECHSVKEGKNKKGPSLFAVVGRKAAALPEVVYSDALKASALTWTPERIDAYLSAPKKLVPGGKMKYEGLAAAGERADLLAYLASLH